SSTRARLHVSTRRPSPPTLCPSTTLFRSLPGVQRGRRVQDQHLHRPQARLHADREAAPRRVRAHRPVGAREDVRRRAGRRPRRERDAHRGLPVVPGRGGGGRMTRALVLDDDAVLADTERDGHLVAFNRAFAELGHPIEWSATEYAALLRVGGGKERLKAYLAEHPEVDLARGGDLDEAVRAAHLRKSEIYVELVEQGALPGRPGVRRLVHEALDAGWQVAVASTSAQRSVEAVLRSVVGEEDYARVAGVFAGDVVPAKKPAPDI